MLISIPFGDSVLASRECIVIGVAEETARVRLGPDTVVNFPRELFSTQPERGQHLAYEIRERPDGTRYQAFMPLGDKGDPKTQARISQLLSEVLEG